MLWEQVTDFMVLILLAAAAVSGGFQDYKAAIVLVIVVAFNVIIGVSAHHARNHDLLTRSTGFVQEYKAEKALASLMSLSVPQAVVIRDGKQSIVPSQELVPGDIVVSNIYVLLSWSVSSLMCSRRCSTRVWLYQQISVCLKLLNSTSTRAF